MIDHVKSIQTLGCAYWKKSRNKNWKLGIYAIYILSVRGIIKYAIVLKSLIQVVFVKIVLVGLRHFRLMKIVIN